MNPRDRDQAVTIRMTEAEIEMLDAVAKAKGLSKSDIVRLAVKAEHDKLERKASK